jgi:hypothetical protein
LQAGQGGSPDAEKAMAELCRAAPDWWSRRRWHGACEDAAPDGDWTRFLGLADKLANEPIFRAKSSNLLIDARCPVWCRRSAVNSYQLPAF